MARYLTSSVVGSKLFGSDILRFRSFLPPPPSLTIYIYIRIHLHYTATHDWRIGDRSVEICSSIYSPFLFRFKEKIVLVEELHRNDSRILDLRFYR